MTVKWYRAKRKFGNLAVSVNSNGTASIYKTDGRVEIVNALRVNKPGKEITEDEARKLIERHTR